MSALDETLKREAREKRATERAAVLPLGMDLYASGSAVRSQGGGLAVACETHWDACLVLLAYGKLAREAA
jgi:hypothetical protein